MKSTGVRQLPDEEEIRICKMYVSGNLSQEKLANKLGYGIKLIENILRRQGNKSRSHSESVRGKLNPRWKGGRITEYHGYIYRYKPHHPFTNKDGYVFEHRLVMEEHIGRYLFPEEVVHHKNNKPSDNDIKNLLLFKNQAEHVRIHSFGVVWELQGGVKKGKTMKLEDLLDPIARAILARAQQKERVVEADEKEKKK